TRFSRDWSSDVCSSDLSASASLAFHCCRALDRRCAPVSDEITVGLGGCSSNAARRSGGTQARAAVSFSCSPVAARGLLHTAAGEIGRASGREGEEQPVV